MLLRVVVAINNASLAAYDSTPLTLHILACKIEWKEHMVLLGVVDRCGRSRNSWSLSSLEVKTHYISDILTALGVFLW